MHMFASWIIFVLRRIWLGKLASAYITVWLIYRQMCALRGSAKKREEVKIQSLALSLQAFFPRRWEFVVSQFLTWSFAAREIAQPVTSHNNAPLSVISSSTPQSLHCQENSLFTDLETPSKSKNFPRWKLKDVKGCFCYDSGQRRKYLWVFKGIFYDTAKWPPGENGGQASTNWKEGLQHGAFRLLVSFG